MKRVFTLLLSILLFFIAYKNEQQDRDDTLGATIFFIVFAIIALFITISDNKVPKEVYLHPRINSENDPNNIPFKIYFSIIMGSIFLLYLGYLYQTK